MPPKTQPLSGLRAWLDAREVRRPLLITGPERRFVSLIEAELAGLSVQFFDRAAVHVPQAVVEAAEARVAQDTPDALITLGGGSATGLGKALRLTHALPFVAIPTTYAGSEMTGIHGILRDDEKQTGRDDRVRPDLVIHDVRFTQSMPRHLTITSLMNALAHPLSALSTGRLDGDGVARAVRAVGRLVEALQTLIAKPHHARARQLAAEGAALAGVVLDQGDLGPHHRVAHHFGGRLAANHAGLHAVLLPHSTATLLQENPTLADRIRAATQVEDLPGTLFELLQRAGVATSLRGLSGAAEVRAAVDALGTLDLSPAARAWGAAAALGRNPTLRYSRVDLGRRQAAALLAVPRPTRAVVALHGRGATAESILDAARAIVGDAPEVMLLAPQADDGAWYAQSYAAESLADAPELAAALAVVDAAVERASRAVGRDNVVLLGFSQGACLGAEWLRRARDPIGGLIGLSGALIGTGPDQIPARSSLDGVEVLLGIAEGDRWVSSEDVRVAAAVFAAAGARVELQVAWAGPHAIRSVERIAARAIILGRPVAGYQPGFGNAHHTEALPGALPIGQNSPRRAPYGLYPEQINGSGFVAHRHQNLRAWMYRIRPSAQHTPFEAVAHPTLVSTFDAPVEPNLTGWSAPDVPTTPTDFVDGLITLGGAGSTALRRGWAAHVYVANKSMDDRAFYAADSDLLLIPQQGRIIAQTEMGLLEVSPGHVAVIPRGVRFSVLLPDGPVRGYVGEVFGRHFELPERGPVGANGLTDPRHFEAPTAWHEDRLHPGYRITARFGGDLFEATQDHSPYDVVAWHGNYAPYRYDLMRFSPVGNTRFDHPDPSIYTVLTAPLDELGSHSLDFVFFPPRWDVSEGTFRPPYFHRNATTEFNGIIQDPSLAADGPFQPGGAFLTPSMTAHGVVARSVERAFRASEASAERPVRIGQRSMWFQFESALPFKLTDWAANGPERMDDWTDIWGVYRAHFTPDRIDGPWEAE